MNQVVRGLNAKVDFDEEAHVVEVDATGDITEEAPYKYVGKMRASIVVLGPILARVEPCQFLCQEGCYREPPPQRFGGYGGQRCPDSWLHRSQGGNLHGAHITMDFPSVRQHKTS